MTDNKESRSENIEGFLTEFEESFSFDRRLFSADIRVSLVYCDSLFQAGVLTRTEAERIKSGLQTILKRADFNKNFFDEFMARDVYSFIEARLVQLVGEAGRKINIGRSRYDQSITAFRLWLREEIKAISDGAKDLQTAFIEAGERQREAILPAYAHRQKAQPILWAHWCLAYFEMLARDRERLDEVWRRVNVLPLGAGILAGTSFEIDREEIARELNFEGITANSLDTVSDADFAIESIGACAILMIHLSRLAEDLILYGSAEYGFIEFLDAHSVNSSPPKNPAVLELVRGKASRILGHQTALLSMKKNLPLGLNKDLQEIQQAVFETVDTLKICLKITRLILENLRVNEENTKKATAEGYFSAAELEDYLIHREVPLKTAQDTVEKIVSYANSKDRKLDKLSLKELRQFSENIEEDVFDALSLEQTLAGKNQIGGTSSERVSEALEAARTSLGREEN